MYKKLLFLLALPVFSITTNAQPAGIEKKLDALLKNAFKPNEPGCAILVASKGKIIYNKAFGSANLELDVPMQPGMVFKIASVSKQFTAVAILQLAAQGKLNVQDSIQQHIPGYPYHGNRITIEHLLTHTSGIPDYMQLNYDAPNMERWDFSPAQLIDSFKNRTVQSVPGTKFSYSNSGYVLLGYIIEKVSGKPYEKYIQENILTQLQMNNTGFDYNNRLIKNRVSGYVKNESGFQNADYWSPSIAYGTGGLLSTTEDLYKWFSGVLAYKVLGKPMLDKAFTPYKLADGTATSYGYGWYVLQSGNLQSVEHAGKMNGFLSNLLYYPGKEMLIIALFNNQDAPKDAVSNAIAEIALGQPLQSASFSPPDELLQTYTGTYYLTIAPQRTLTISKKGKGLQLQVAGQDAFELLFETAAAFQLKGIKDVKGAFISDEGKVTRIVVEQNGRFEWVRKGEQ